MPAGPSLPRGGHLGYVMHPWVKAKLMKLFAPRPAPERVVVKAAPDAPKPKPERAAGDGDRHGTGKTGVRPWRFLPGRLRCGDKAMVEKALTECNGAPGLLVRT